jgi:putative glycosyltransferase
VDLSIVTTLYNSAAYLEQFYARASAVAGKMTTDFEIVFVNDGSPDNSLEIALAIFQQDSRVRVIDLSRNFGHHKAMMTGLRYARGKLIFLIDSDLEEEPELLEEFYRTLESTGADVAYGIQQTRKGRFLERISGAMYFGTFNILSTYPIPKNHITARLMTQRYVAALLTHREREFVISGLWVLTGFKQVALPVKKHYRGASSYNLRRKISHFVNAITSFSSKPLDLIFYLGCLILFISSIAAFDLLIRKMFFGVLLAGWPSLIISVWLLGGLTIFCLGLIGIYLSKIYIEVKQRPYTVVREVYERKEVPSALSDQVVYGAHFEKEFEKEKQPNSDGRR